MKLLVYADQRFEEHFQNLLQVFLYVTDECNLRCAQCYYKPWLKNRPAEMESDVIIALLQKFREMGAIKLSLLGGEPTLYGQHSNNETLPFIIKQAREMGFKYLRMVSNGLFESNFLDDERLRLLDEITFSIDGDTPEMHDSLRGKGTYRKSIQNVKRAISLKYNVHITTCVHRDNVGRDEDGTYLLDRAIRWATDLGANLINFHPLFKMNIPRDSWTGETDISPKEWIAVFNEISQNVNEGKYRIPVRLPQRFVTSEQFASQSSYFSFCPVKMAERIEVHPNGQIHSCALNNGTPISLAKFTRENNHLNITWSIENNELREYPFDFSRNHPCAVMQKDFGNLVPLCISFKPNQEEFIWKTVGLS